MKEFVKTTRLLESDSFKNSRIQNLQRFQRQKSSKIDKYGSDQEIKFVDKKMEVCEKKPGNFYLGMKIKV